MRTSCASEAASIFSITRARWISTVRWLRPRSAAITLFALPTTTRSSTPRERGEPVARVVPRAQQRAQFGIAGEGALHAREQVVVAKGLLQEVVRARLHRLDGHRHIAVAGDEHDRNRRAERIQALLQLEAAHPGHAHIEHDAARARAVVACEEIVGGSVQHRIEPVGLEQQAQRAADRVVVVDHEDRGVAVFHDSSGAGGRVNAKRAPCGALGR